MRHNESSSDSPLGPIPAQKRTSTLHGAGVFATSDIPAGAPVVRCQGEVVSAENVAPNALVMQIGPDTYLQEDPSTPEIDGFINHSCDPNLGFIDGSLVLHALRDIPNEEELTWDYSTSMNEVGWEMSCNCRSPQCRRVVTSFCHLTKPQQQRLLPIALAYLREQYGNA